MENKRTINKFWAEFRGKSSRSNHDTDFGSSTWAWKAKKQPFETIKPYLDKAKMQSPRKRIKGSWRHEQFWRLRFRWFKLGPWCDHLLQFKVLEFEKYDGFKCPKTQLVVYCHGWAPRNEEIAYTYLVRVTTKWYLRWKKNQIHTWKDLVQTLSE